jgi:hypothetical protein
MPVPVQTTAVRGARCCGSGLGDCGLAGLGGVFLDRLRKAGARGWPVGPVSSTLSWTSTPLWNAVMCAGRTSLPEGSKRGWPACPAHIEVLELSSRIKSLRRSQE